ncbi:molybdenum cofactor guanylyltransferase MobA [Sulfurovum sp. bin170]|uniref:molybdenum cofactor guanylyltransferase MobA n=1 Tax=Sulfurovum sp. bin170 TaxID=2695268 RepID=UPI0013DFC55E|nr:molybdenum cofactor guanylyltransferase MobA [Sulfurovum sp. bin170]NEW60104.1 molybdenum cofactor guanylyltransferase MobA [Sulfurovum sp. bin170]
MNNKQFGSAIIFAGGKSSRMGQDKALLPFGGYSTLAEYQYVKLSEIFDKVYISAKSNKFDFDCSVIEDCYEESSPLVGIVSIFESLDIEEIFILSVDAPFIDIETIEKLYENSISSKDVIVAKSSFGVEPLCAIYRRTILSKAKELLEENNHRLQALLSSVETQIVEFDRDENFMNLNHPEEYQKAINSPLLTSLQS